MSKTDNLQKQRDDAAWVLKRVIDKCREYPNELASLQILALIKKWSES